jgi:hypothetical protein
MSKKLVIALPYTGQSQRITVPAGVEPTATAYLWGGGGGGGGDDSPGVGGNGAAGQAYKVTFPIQTGDVLDLAPGGGGGFGSSNSAASLAGRSQTIGPGTTSIVIPAGVTQISVSLSGAGGGGAGLDYGGLGVGNNGLPGKKISGVIPVTPGDTLTFHIGTGGQGGAGVGSRTRTERTAGGTNPYLGNGGEAGTLLVSGQGGGGGAASVILKNSTVFAIAGGGGGGGGSGTNSTGRTRINSEYTTVSDGAQGANVNDAGSGGGGGGGWYGGKGGAAGGGDTGAYQGSQGKSQLPTGWSELDSNNGAAALRIGPGIRQPSGGDGVCLISYTEFVGSRQGGSGGQGYVATSGDRFGGGNGGVAGPAGASGAGGGGGGASILALNNTVIAVAAGGGGGGGGGNKNTVNGDSAITQPTTDNVATVGQNGANKTGDGGGAGGGGGGRFGGQGGDLRSGDQGAGAGGSGTSYRKVDQTSSGDSYFGTATTPPSVDGYSVGPTYASGGTRRNPGNDGYIIIEFQLYALPYVNVGNEWFPTRQCYFNINSNWKEITAGYVKVGGQWQSLVQGLTITPASLGAGVRYGAGGTRAR